MSFVTLAQIDKRIADIRANMRDLIEQAAARSGANDESRMSDLIARQEEELKHLQEKRDALEK